LASAVGALCCRAATALSVTQSIDAICKQPLVLSEWWPEKEDLNNVWLYSVSLLRVEGRRQDLLDFWEAYQEALWPNWAQHPESNQPVLKERMMVREHLQKHAYLMFSTGGRFEHNLFNAAHTAAIAEMKKRGVEVVDRRSGPPQGFMRAVMLESTT